jgi:hypothetical protein
MHRQKGELPVRMLCCVAVVLGLTSLAFNSPATEPSPPGRAAPAFNPVRPMSVGQRHRVIISYARGFEFQITGVPSPREIHVNQAVELCATAEVLAVNDYGNPTKVRLVVESGSYKKGDRLDLKEELKPGEVLTFEFKKGDGFSVTRDRGEWPRVLLDMFNDALPYSRTALTDRRNVRFFDPAGQPAPRKAGEPWTMEGAFLTALTPRSIRLDKTRLTGTMTAGRVSLGGESCVKLDAKMQLPRYTGDEGSLVGALPRDLKITDGTFDGRVACWVPADPNRQPLKWTESWRGTLTGYPKQGHGQAVVAVHTTRTIELADLGGN